MSSGAAPPPPPPPTLPEAPASRRFDGRVAVVTGGAAGIGAACAHRLAAEVAAAVAFLLSPDASFITGSALAVVGGWSGYTTSS